MALHLDPLISEFKICGSVGCPFGPYIVVLCFNLKYVDPVGVHLDDKLTDFKL